ncbi:MAG: type I polyketide synthase [Gammaproteobacteria bacterium]|jgi:acyl transferase domain-containing protein|nr:type I polyketide synthase [Gammaproteobacteria bacterium]
MTDHIDDSDIAIVGMAIRVPGANSPEQYWKNLVESVESVRQYSDEELLERGVSAETLANPDYVRAGMPLQGYDQFDPEFFGFSPKEAAILDPQHRQFYEVAWEALERAGHPPQSFDGAVGVFAGCGMSAYFALNLLTNPDLVDSVGMFLLRHTGNDKDFLATRVSYSFNLRGPSVNVQTACSTSLVATHLAVQSLLSGECDMALAGGSTVELPHEVGYVYKEGEVLSPDGHCRTFDHRSKGTVFGSGTGVVVLRRLADALADGDHIHAVIKGSAVNNDGSGKVGYLAPSVDGQAAAVAEALAVANIPADSVSYIECHGTATPVGDPIEIAALTRAFRESTDRNGFCSVGSVKTNIGHLDTAAGVAGLIKTALALEHRAIPASLHFEAPNPAIDFDTSPFKVAAEYHSWESASAPRRAGVNSLGVGGTNAFVVLEEAPATAPPGEDSSPQLLVMSARNRRALDEAGERLAAWLQENPQQQLCDVAWTLQSGRQAFEHRRVLACRSHAEAVEILTANDPQRLFSHSAMAEQPSIVFMYPGGGAQYARMGLNLYAKEPVFREWIDRGLEVLKSRFDADLAAVFFARADSADELTAALDKPATQLPLTFLVEYALTRLWESLGIRPDALIGHSMGENTAAAVAGVMSFEDALGLLRLRGRLFEQAPPGGMLSVPLSVGELRDIAGPDIDIAAANGPQLAVASGSPAALDELSAALASAGVDAQRIRVDVAAHSRLLEGILGEFRAYLHGIDLHAPEIPIVSNRSGTWLTNEQAQDAEYWVQHLRNTVLFADGVATLLEKSNRVFLEVGPGNVLGSCVRQNGNAPVQRVLPSMRHPKDEIDDQVFLRAVIGRLWAIGVDMDLGQLHPEPRRRLPLPTYPFQHARYWIEPGTASAGDSHTSVRPMAAPNTDDWYWQPRWVQRGLVETDTRCETWLIFLTDEPVMQAVVEQLRAAGRIVVTVRAGDTFWRIDRHNFTLAAEAGGIGYQELIAELESDGLLPQRILHGWLLTGDRSFRPGSTLLHRNQEFGFYSLFYLARALAKGFPEGEPLHLIVAANGVQRIADEAAPYPDKATVLGPCGVIPREFPHFSCSFVDVQLPDIAGKPGRRQLAAQEATRAAALDALLNESEAPAANEVVAWRDGVRWQRFITRRPPPASAAPKLRQNGVYLLTGGFGGIAREISGWLATTWKARLVLVGRTPLPAREDWEDWLTQHDSTDSISAAIHQVKTLESLGAEVLPVAADVTVAEQMRDVVTLATDRFGPVNGVFHTAGVVRDNLIQLKSPREIEEVFAAKLYGTLVLDELFRESTLDFMLLFSSTSAFIAPQGQVDYVGASAFVNTFAAACSGERPYKVCAVNWGIWKDVGMVAPGAGDTGTTEDEFDNARREPVAYPLFRDHYRSRDGVTNLHTFTGSLATGEHWVVDDHRLRSGEALLSGTGFVELIRAALHEADVATPWEIRNLVFQNPLFVPDERAREFRVRARGSQGRWDVDVLAAADESATQWQECAGAKVTAADSTALAKLDIGSIKLRCSASVNRSAGAGKLRTRQEDHLRFGPRWQVLRELRLGDDEALARLELGSEHRADLQDYALHPALLDIATGCAMDLIPGYADQEVARNLWVPVGYQRLRFHAPLQSELVSWIRTAAENNPGGDYAAFNITIAAPDGRVLAEVEQLTLRRTDSAPQPVLLQSDRLSGRMAVPPLKSLAHCHPVRKHSSIIAVRALSRIRASRP